MLQQQQPQGSSLGIPKSAGRSRFSKALPSIPPIDTSPIFASSSTLSPTTLPTPTASTPRSATHKPLPKAKNLQDLPPPPPPPHDDDPRVPIQFTPLPPLPPSKKSSSSSATPTTPKTPTAPKPPTAPKTPTASIAPKTPSKTPSGSSKSAITRKPVGLRKPVASAESKHQNTTSNSTVASVASMGSKKEEKKEVKEIKGMRQLKEPVKEPVQEQGKDQTQRQSEQVQTPSPPQQSQQPQTTTTTATEQLPPVPPKSEARSPEPANKTPNHLSPPQEQEAFDAQLQQPLKSPSESLSSILSAYSRSSTASVVRSSDGTTYSAVEYQPYEPKPDTLPEPSLQQKKSLTRKPVGVVTGKKEASASPPPPPSKDTPASPPRTLNSDATISAPSPPRQQIWRRRSLKGSRELPDLRLDHSHGSTASSSSISTITAVQKPPQPPSKSPTPPAVPEKSTPSSSDSSAAQAPQPPAKDRTTMGQEGSRIERLKKKIHTHTHRGSNDSTKSVKKDQAAPAVNRPPTPEYQKEDGKATSGTNFVTTVSPVSSPEPAQQRSAALSSGLSEPPSAPTEQKPIIRKAVPAIDTGKDAGKTVQPIKSMPDIKAKASGPAQGGLPPASAFPATGRNSPAPFDAPRGRRGGPPEMHPPSSRDTSVARPSSRSSVRPGGPVRFPPPEADPRLVRTENGDFLYKGRDGTLYAEMKELPEPDPSAMRFPQRHEELASPGAIFKAPTLRESHYTCYQKHKNMLRRANKRYPLACQTCQRQDNEDRFACSFCYVRMCEGCLKQFEEKQRDLRALVAELSNNGTLSLSSPTRRGSALGLEINF